MAVAAIRSGCCARSICKFPKNKPNLIKPSIPFLSEELSFLPCILFDVLESLTPCQDWRSATLGDSRALNLYYDLRGKSCYSTAILHNHGKPQTCQPKNTKKLLWSLDHNSKGKNIKSIHIKTKESNSTNLHLLLFFHYRVATVSSSSSSNPATTAPTPPKAAAPPPATNTPTSPSSPTGGSPFTTSPPPSTPSPTHAPALPF